MQGTIVLAEDSKTVRRMVEIALAKHPFVMEFATDGQSALEAVRSKSPSVLLVDTNLTGIDGYEVARQVKSASPHVKVYLLAGTHQALDAQRAATVGADGHLVKPFLTQDLLDLVYQATTGKPAPGGELFRDSAAPIPLARKIEAPKPAAPVLPVRPAPPVVGARPGAPAPPSRLSAPAAANPFSGAQNPFEQSEPTRPFFKPAGMEDATGVFEGGATSVAPLPLASMAQASAPMGQAVSSVGQAIVDDAAIQKALTGLSKDAIERLLWEIVPPLAEAILKEEIARIVRERMASA